MTFTTKQMDELDELMDATEVTHFKAICSKCGETLRSDTVEPLYERGWRVIENQVTCGACQKETDQKETDQKATDQKATETKDAQ